MLRQCCCCCAIIVVFSLFTAFLSIDAGCSESKETAAEQPRARWPNRAEWREYCKSVGQQYCNGHVVRPCITSAATGECTAANLSAAPDLTPNETWDTFCENIQSAWCHETAIKPCFWHTYTSGEQACVAKRSDRIFVVDQVRDGEQNDGSMNE